MRTFVWVKKKNRNRKRKKEQIHEKGKIFVMEEKISIDSIFFSSCNEYGKQFGESGDFCAIQL